MENKIIKAGTKIVIGTHAGFAGTDNMTAYILGQDYTEDELSNIAWQEGIQWADSYGVYPMDDMPEDYDEENEGDNYSDNIEGWWELYISEKHEGHCTFGGHDGPTFNKL